MSGDLFPSRQAAIHDANRHFREIFGNEAMFPDGNDGSLVEPTQGIAAWGFQVIGPLGDLVAQYVVHDLGQVAGFTWSEVEKAW